MKIGSLFSGIGGLELGLERAIPGAEVVWQVEKDEYARRVLAKHWPEARRFEDVRKVGRSNLAPVGLVCGGFPCQDLSYCGKGAGLDGERSGLWSEFARIIGEMAPLGLRYVVLENVPALLTRGMGRILTDLLATGWLHGCAWDCIPASSIGAPHQRDRWFFVGWHRATLGAIPDAGGKYGDRWGGAERRSSRNRKFILHGAERPMAAAVRPGLERWGEKLGETGTKRQVEARFGSESTGSNWWATLSDVGRGLDGVPAGMDGAIAPWEVGIPRTCGKIPDRSARLRCLGNAVVPQVAELVGRVVAELERAI